jgi:hypothetical protein
MLCLMSLSRSSQSHPEKVFLVELLKRRGPFGQTRRNFMALNGPKYKPRGLERLLDQYFQYNPHLDCALTSVVIPAFDTKIQQPIFFSSWKVINCVPTPLLLTTWWNQLGVIMSIISIVDGRKSICTELQNPSSQIIVDLHLSSTLNPKTNSIIPSGCSWSFGVLTNWH